MKKNIRLSEQQVKNGGLLTISKNAYNKIISYYKNMPLNVQTKLKLFLGIGLKYTKTIGGDEKYSIKPNIFTDPENPTTEELNKYLFPDCVYNILSLKKEANFVQLKNGIVVVKRWNTGNKSIDSKQGLYFFNNNRVYSVDGTLKGSYKCENGIAKIVWDKPLVKPVTQPSTSTPKKKSIYHPCANLPFEFGCKSETIRQIQEIILLPEKYQTGNFGPITLKKLKEFGAEQNITAESMNGLNQTTPTITEGLYLELLKVQRNIGGTKLEPSSIKPLSLDNQPLNTTEPQINTKTINEDVIEIKDFMKRLLK